MKKKLSLKAGTEVYYQQEKYVIDKILDFDHVLLQNSKGAYLRGAVSGLRSELPEPVPGEKNADADLHSLDPEKWEEAKKRFKIIRPIIEKKVSVEKIKQIAKKNKVSTASIYRWVSRYNDTGTITSLVPSERSGGKGKSRLDERVEQMINAVIEKDYLTSQKLSVQKIAEIIIKHAKTKKLPAPHPDTVRRRVQQLSDYTAKAKREDKKLADSLYRPIKGTFPGADGPLSVVQIDHTKLDIILVDEKNRMPIGRPWITLAIDVYSRMVAGFYVSYDPPGAIGTGICIANSILPKNKWLTEFDITGTWPSWGIMKRIHMDNAKEFHGNMLKRACEEHGINISWRPVATPHWGGHIERLLGTLLKEIHTLPGTTFSNIKQKGKYNSENRASFTLFEFEKWLMDFVVNVYHKRLHRGIGTSPIEKYKEGVFGSDQQKGVGLPDRIIDERKLRLDFLPFFERSVLKYGVLIDHIFYYHDVLKRYINITDRISGKGRTKTKFIFRRDPRDISVIFFWDPETKEYYEIPYRDFTHPPMSIWDYKHTLLSLKKNNVKLIDENAIFEAYDRLKGQVDESVKKTSKTKKNFLKSISRKTIQKEIASVELTSVIPLTPAINWNNIQPYEEQQN